MNDSENIFEGNNIPEDINNENEEDMNEEDMNEDNMNEDNMNDMNEDMNEEDINNNKARIKFSIYDIICEFISMNKRSLICYFILSVGITFTNILVAHYYSKTIDTISTQNKMTSDLKKQLLSVTIIWTSVQFLWGIINWIDSDFIPRLQSFVREKFISRIIDLYKERYQEQEIGLLIAHIIKLPLVIKDLVYQIRNNVIPTISVFIVSLIYFFYIDKSLGIIASTTFISYLSVIFMFNKNCLEYSLAMNDEYYNLHEHISDILTNLLNVYTSVEDKNEVLKFIEKQDILISKSASTMKCTAKHKMLFNLTYLMVFFGINGYALHLFLNKKCLKGPQIVSVFIVSLYLMTEMTNLIKKLDDIYYNVWTMKHIQDYINELDLYDELPIDMNNNNNMNNNSNNVNNVNNTNDNYFMNGDIVYKNVTIKRGDKTIIKNLNLTIGQGDKICIVGKIGSGKTTLINTLIRLMPYSGKISIGKKNIKDVKLETLRKSIIYVPQQPKLFNRTIYENINYGNNKTKQEIQEVLDKYNLDFQLDYNVGKNGENLSGGQRQMIYLIRCMFRKSNIIVMDEPTSSLDSDTKNHILNILSDLLRNKTVIIVSHDSEVIEKYVDRMIDINSINNA
jgi:ATP-binding cassette subfamily B protein